MTLTLLNVTLMCYHAENNLWLPKCTTVHMPHPHAMPTPLRLPTLKTVLRPPECHCEVKVKVTFSILHYHSGGGCNIQTLAQ